MKNIQAYSMLLIIPFICVILSKWIPWLIWPAAGVLLVVGIADIRRVLQKRQTFSNYIQGQMGKMRDAVILIALIGCAYIPWGWQGILIAVVYVLADHLFGFWN